MWSVMGEKNNDIEKLSDDKSDEVGVEDSTESTTEESPVEDGSSIVSETEVMFNQTNIGLCTA